MNDCTKRESIVNFALKNGIELPADFNCSDGTYKNSEAAKELADKILAVMDEAIEACFASGDKGAAQKNLSALANMMCRLDRNAQDELTLIRAELEQLSARMKRADASLSDKKTVLEFTAQTLELLDYYSKIGERGMNPANSARLAAMLNNVINTLENNICDGYSNKANYSAIGVANAIINLRNDVSVGMVASFTLNALEATLAKELEQWCALQIIPEEKDICFDKYKVKINNCDVYFTLTQIPELKAKAENMFNAFNKIDSRNRLSEILEKMDQLHSQYVAYENEIKSVVDLADNGRISDAEAEAKIVELEGKQAELQERYNKLNRRLALMKPEVEENEKLYSSMDLIKRQYDFYCNDGQYATLASVFSPSELDYDSVTRAFSTGCCGANMHEATKIICSFADKLKKRNDYIDAQNDMFEQKYSKHKRRGNSTENRDDTIAHSIVPKS